MKSKIAIFVLADSESFEGLGRVFNAMEAVKELAEAGDDVRLYFDGAGTKWIGALSNPEHKAHALFKAIEGRVAGACSFCAGVFGVEKPCQTMLVDEYEGHPSIKRLLRDGYQVITY